MFTVTDLTRVIDGVRAVVLWDRDFNAGQIVETELAVFAQDDDGNVWLLGEYPEAWEDGEFSGAPDVWFSGVARARARAGIMMGANPQPGTSSYLQGFAPGVGDIQVGAVGGKEQEVLVLVKLSQLDPGALAQAREEALKLERHADRVRKDVYGRTQPAEHTP